MSITQSNSLFALVRECVNPADYYSVRLPGMSRKAPQADGWIDGGLCPFHRDRHAGSFRVNVKTGSYRCFSCDHRGGDIIDFEAEHLSCSLIQAARNILDEWGVYR